MKPWLLTAVLLIAVAGGAATLTVNTAQPALEAASSEPEPQLPAFESMVPTPLVEQGPKVAFKWQDEHGAWHYADTPPSSNTPSETLTLGPTSPKAIGRPDPLLGNEPRALSAPES
jgi:hypothetical protein